MRVVNAAPGSALDRARTAREGRGQKADERLDLVFPGTALGVRLRPSEWATDRQAMLQIVAKDLKEAVELAAIHLAAHTEAVFGVDDNGSPQRLFDDGNAVLDERLADALGFEWISPARLLAAFAGPDDLTAPDAIEEAFYIHSEWSGHTKSLVRRLGE